MSCNGYKWANFLRQGHCGLTGLKCIRVWGVLTGSRVNVIAIVQTPVFKLDLPLPGYFTDHE